MKNPTLANWVRFKELNEDEYLVYDLNLNERHTLDAYSVWFAQHLNGETDPYKIDKNLTKNETDDLLKDLEEKNVIRDKRFAAKNIFRVLVTLLQPNITPTLRVVSFFLNGLLMLSFMPLFLTSIVCFLKIEPYINYDFALLGSVVGLVVGLVFHELGHMFAAAGYGALVFELGIGIQTLMPCAYVMMNDKNIKKKSHKIQINAAGVEMNLLLTAVFVFLAVKFINYNGFFLMAALQNFVMAISNLIFIRGLDGAFIMSNLLGIEKIFEKAGETLRNKGKRRRLLKQGTSGKAILASCFLIKGIQIASPLYLIVAIVGVVLCFQ